MRFKMLEKIKMITVWIIWTISISPLLSMQGCSKASPKVYNLGIVEFSKGNKVTYEGFMVGMAEQGYIDGKNIRYIHDEIPEDDDQIIDTKIKSLLTKDIDLIFTTGKLTLNVKKLAKGNIPVLFSGDSFPVETGLVQSLQHPGGNITGVKIADTIPKALEWLVTIDHEAKIIYLPYDPNDPIAAIQLPGLEKAASQIGIKLVLQKVYSIEETVAEIENLPDDIDAMFLIPSKILNPRNNELCLAAVKRGISTGAALQLDGDVLVTFTNDFFNIGKKTARLAHQIFQGVKPADLPVETGDEVLIINLNVAERIGISIPGNILAQATTIIYQ